MGYTGVASQRSSCLEADKLFCKRLPRLGDALVLTRCATRRACGCWALRHIRRRGKLTEHTEELSYREADPEGQLEKWLLIMVVDKFASVRTN